MQALKASEASPDGTKRCSSLEGLADLDIEWAREQRQIISEIFPVYSMNGGLWHALGREQESTRHSLAFTYVELATLLVGIAR